MFKPGESGNPSGRKKIDPKIKKALEAALPKAVKVLVSLLESEDEDIRLKAANSICDRNLGKPVQAISDPDGNALRQVVIVRPDYIGKENEDTD